VEAMVAGRQSDGVSIEGAASAARHLQRELRLLYIIRLYIIRQKVRWHPSATRGVALRYAEHEREDFR
jgi:hypothetical protein